MNIDEEKLSREAIRLGNKLYKKLIEEVHTIGVTRNLERIPVNMYLIPISILLRKSFREIKDEHYFNDAKSIIIDIINHGFDENDNAR